jgi:threonine/homoserine/homoserine lactone efflux protein
VLTGGYRSVLPFLAAMWVGEAIWLTLAVCGLSYVAQTFYLLFGAIKYAGVIYLLYLAWTMWSAPTEVEDESVPRETSAGKSPRAMRVANRTSATVMVGAATAIAAR